MSKFDVGRDYSKAPPTLCPHCNQTLHLTLQAFQEKEGQLLIKSNCPFCRKEIIASLQILITSDLNTMNKALHTIQEAFRKARTRLHLIDNPNKPS